MILLRQGFGGLVSNRQGWSFAALVFAIVLTGCSPSLSKVEKYGYGSSTRKIDGEMVNYRFGFWTTYEGQYAFIAFWDDSSDKFREAFQWKDDHGPTPGRSAVARWAFGETYHFLKLTFSTTNQTITFTERDPFKPGICRLVYAKDGRIQIEECTQQEAVQLIEQYTAKAHEE